MKTQKELENELHDTEERVMEIRKEIAELVNIFNEEVGYERLLIERDGDGFLIWLITTTDTVSIQCDYDFLVSLNKALTDKL